MKQPEYFGGGGTMMPKTTNAVIKHYTVAVLETPVAYEFSFQISMLTIGHVPNFLFGSIFNGETHEWLATSIGLPNSIAEANKAIEFTLSIEKQWATSLMFVMNFGDSEDERHAYGTPKLFAADLTALMIGGNYGGKI